MKNIKYFKSLKTLTEGGKGYWQALDDFKEAINEIRGFYDRCCLDLMNTIKSKIEG